MIGIVIVSHSETLARGVLELIDQMTQGRVAVALAAGVDNPDDPIGTDPMRVLTAIEAVYSDDGVLLLMDLGSAIMSAEAAIEFLPPEQQAHIYLCEAPLVEGALAAAVQAMGGGAMEAVFDEARAALEAKTEQLRPLLRMAPAVAAPPAAADALAAEESETITLTIPNRLGLHARPAARLVRLAHEFQAHILLEVGERSALATSINQVATLGARQGDRLIVRAAGPDAAAAVAAVETLAADNFGDVEEAAALPAEAAPASAAETLAEASDDGVIWGERASPGVAIGPVLRLAPSWPAQSPQAPVDRSSAGDPSAELARLAAAIAAAEADLRVVHQTMRQRVGPAEAAIFDAHLLMLADVQLRESARRRIVEAQFDAAGAWHCAIEEAAAGYRALGGYMARRAHDVIDVGLRVLNHLMDDAPAIVSLPEEPVILAAESLTPRDVAELDRERVLGVIAAAGTATDHSMILLRALGVPAVVSAGAALTELEDGQTVGLDGASGRIWLAPDATTAAALREDRAAWQAAISADRAVAQQPAILRNGRQYPVLANIGNDGDAAHAMDQGAEGVGLFRTEFLFMQRDEPPDEAEQYAAYAAAAEALAGRPLTVRTLDVGGDKPLPYWPMDGGANPFLGMRGIRYCLAYPELFLPQLRALLRAGADYDVRIMLPMVSVADEITQTRALLDETAQALKAAGVPCAPAPPVGIMIETPAAVTMAPALARHVDFFSIGTNDLTQYIMAADRTNARTAGLVNGLQPAVIHAIDASVRAARAAGIGTSVCGEMAGDPLAVPLLVGLGVDELSASGAAIPQVKARLRTLDEDAAQTLAQQALTLSSTAEIQALLQEFADSQTV